MQSDLRGVRAMRSRIARDAVAPRARWHRTSRAIGSRHGTLGKCFTGYGSQYYPILDAVGRARVALASHIARDGIAPPARWPRERVPASRARRTKACEIGQRFFCCPVIRCSYRSGTNTCRWGFLRLFMNPLADAGFLSFRGTTRRISELKFYFFLKLVLFLPKVVLEEASGAADVPVNEDEPRR